MQKLRIFIGSSMEGLALAQRLREEFEDIADVVVWDGLFTLGETAIEGLFNELRRATHAVLVATCDDSARIRGISFTTPRDNVIFELGLFMGRLGRRRTYLLADKALKLPSDLAGLTIAIFETDCDTFTTNTDEAVKKVKEAVLGDTLDDDAQLLESFTKIIGNEKFELWTTYADILRARYHDIAREINSLRALKSWARILETKTLLREFLEYSGAYEDAYRFGTYYFTALTELNRTFEAAWSKVKDIGYMSILAGRHARGRKAIAEVIQSEETWAAGTTSEEVAELLAYAHRYLAISYHRDSALGDLLKADHHLRVAKEMADKITLGTTRYCALKARLDRNEAHIKLCRGDLNIALNLYNNCLDYFTQLEEYEHIASTRLSIANALLMSKHADTADILNHLGAADRIYEHIGAIEGRAKVNLTYTRFFLNSSDSAPAAETSRFLSEADKAYRKAAVLLERLGSTQFYDDMAILQGELQARMHSLNFTTKQ